MSDHLFLATMMGCLVKREGGELRIPRSEWRGLEHGNLSIVHDSRTGELVARLSKTAKKARERHRPVCDDCGVYPADSPGALCPGCEAYREHTGQI